MKRPASRRPELVSDGLTGEEEVEGQRYKSDSQAMGMEEGLGIRETNKSRPTEGAMR